MRRRADAYRFRCSAAADWKGGHQPTGLGTGVIDFVASPVFAEQGPADLSGKTKEIWAEIETARKGIIDGSIKVEFNTQL